MPGLLRTACGAMMCSCWIFPAIFASFAMCPAANSFSACAACSYVLTATGLPALFLSCTLAKTPAPRGVPTLEATEMFEGASRHAAGLDAGRAGAPRGGSAVAGRCEWTVGFVDAETHTLGWRPGWRGGGSWRGGAVSCPPTVDRLTISAVDAPMLMAPNCSRGAPGCSRARLASWCISNSRGSLGLSAGARLSARADAGRAGACFAFSRSSISRAFSRRMRSSAVARDESALYAWEEAAELGRADAGFDAIAEPTIDDLRIEDPPTTADIARRRRAGWSRGS